MLIPGRDSNEVTSWRSVVYNGVVITPAYQGTVAAQSYSERVTASDFDEIVSGGNVISHFFFMGISPNHYGALSMKTNTKE